MRKFLHFHGQIWTVKYAKPRFHLEFGIISNFISAFKLSMKVCPVLYLRLYHKTDTKDEEFTPYALTGKPRLKWEEVMTVMSE
mmetsp:Transcript_34396/g.6202  ORF Transcript_34396/g.6202 Transcript_34396/m.6202 type:complete len:83 (+) Transcript_34396:601-849(+)